jgi:hypothetical protein
MCIYGSMNMRKPTSINVHLQKSASIYAHLQNEASVYVCIHKCKFMEVGSCICAYKKVHIYRR